jgi:hypothetical protein
MIPTPRDSQPTAPSAPEKPAEMPPLTISERSDDGRWELLTHEGGVIVLMERTTIAEAHIWPLGQQTTIEFWVDGVELPVGLAAHLVAQSFTHPAVHARRSVLICLPRGSLVLQQQVLRMIQNARTSEAGLARLIEGTIRDASIAPKARAAGA